MLFSMHLNSKKLQFLILPVAATLAVLTQGCSPKEPIISDLAAYEESIKEWQHNRLERLKSKNGWLNLAGLFWLSEGENSFGSDPSNDIVFPEKAEAFCGTLTLRADGGVALKASEAAKIKHEDQLITDLDLIHDHAENTTFLEQGDLAWYIVKRAERYGIRMRDYKHPRIQELDHIPSYPVKAEYLVEAKLVPFDEPKMMEVATPIEGFTETYECPGVLHFEINQTELRLHPFKSGKGYFLVLADETTGIDTYGAGRFMYSMPDSTGRIILDFNKAYNPPCAFSPFATCPMPPRENYLSVSIEAGEKSVHLD